MKKDPELTTARHAIEATTDLAQCAGFTWYVNELKRRADELAHEILSNDMDAAEREKLRQRRLQLLEILQMPADARMSAEGILTTYQRGNSGNEDDF
jgi:hypothetical protein